MREAADAIVLGRRGRGRLAGSPLGSVSQKVAPWEVFQNLLVFDERMFVNDQRIGPQFFIHCPSSGLRMAPFRRPQPMD